MIHKIMQLYTTERIEEKKKGEKKQINYINRLPSVNMVFFFFNVSYRNSFYWRMFKQTSIFFFLPSRKSKQKWLFESARVY